MVRERALSGEGTGLGPEPGPSVKVVRDVFPSARSPEPAAPARLCSGINSGRPLRPAPPSRPRPSVQAPPLSPGPALPARAEARVRGGGGGGAAGPRALLSSPLLRPRLQTELDFGRRRSRSHLFRGPFAAGSRALHVRAPSISARRPVRVRDETLGGVSVSRGGRSGRGGGRAPRPAPLPAGPLGKPST